MPPKYVKTVSDVINFYYALLVIARAAGKMDEWGFITYQFKRLKEGEIQWSDFDGEIRLQMRSSNKCVYCGDEANGLDHVVPKSLGAPEGVHNTVKVCKHCNSSKGDKDLVDWWINDRGMEINTLPRIPIGIYLKISYGWHKINHSLDRIANELKDLRPFRPVKL